MGRPLGPKRVVRAGSLAQSVLQGPVFLARFPVEAKLYFLGQVSRSRGRAVCDGSPRPSRGTQPLNDSRANKRREGMPPTLRSASAVAKTTKGKAIAKRTSTPILTSATLNRPTAASNALVRGCDGMTTIGGVPVNGRVQYTASNGMVVDTEYKGGRMNGVHKFATPDGRVCECNYVDDKEHGYEVCAHPSGHRTEAHYVYGVKHGLEITRFEAGGVMMINYVHGAKQGRALAWLNRGQGQGQSQDVVHYEMYRDNEEVSSLRHVVTECGRIIPSDGSVVATGLAKFSEKKKVRFDQAMAAVDAVKETVSNQQYLELCNTLKACYDATEPQVQA